MKFILSLLFIGAISATVIYYMREQQNYLSKKIISSSARADELDKRYQNTKEELEKTAHNLDILRNEDQRTINQNLEKSITEIKSAYKEAVGTYEELLKLREATSKTTDFDNKFTSVLLSLSKGDYASGTATLTALKKSIAGERDKIASSFSIPQNVPTNNAPPGSGYRRQVVQTDIGSYMVDIVAADLNSTRVIVDTASDSNCANDCPVLSLGDFVSRSGAYAGINGPYFCPATYPSCDGKKNSFDTLIMNKKKYYFNSDNNIYSTVPAVIFSGSSARWVSRSLEWGRDTGVDAVIAGQPLLIFNGNVTFGGDGEVKRSGKGLRSFIGTKGTTVFIGVVHNANVAEVARVLKALGLENALNLDSGGSTALMSGGKYLAGPGRSTPFGILLVRK